MSFANTLPNHLRPRREKIFGRGRPRPLDREAKIRIMTRARALSQKTEKGKHYGAITAKTLDVLQALLWTFHNAKAGWCYPSYQRIAEAARCAPSTVGEAIKALEDAGLLTWVNCIARIRERCEDLFGRFGTRWRVIRTSNAYAFIDPSPQKRPESLVFSSNTEKQLGTTIQDSSSSKQAPSPTTFDLSIPNEASLARLYLGIKDRETREK